MGGVDLTTGYSWYADCSRQYLYVRYRLTGNGQRAMRIIEYRMGVW